MAARANSTNVEITITADAAAEYELIRAAKRNAIKTPKKPTIIIR